MSEQKIFDVGIDKTIQSVIDSDGAGETLRFNDDPKEFLELPEDVVKVLSHGNQTNYYISLGAFRKQRDWLKEHGDAPVTQPIETTDRNEPSGEFNSDKFKREATEMNRRSGGAYATATKRLYAKPSEEFSRKFDLVWKRPDELQQVGYDGGTMVTTGDGVEFNISPTEGHFEVRSPLTKETELIAIKYLKEDHEAILREPAERSKKRIGAFDKQAKQNMEKDGGLAYVPGQKGVNPAGFNKLL
jgi:hypothetical protein